MRNGKGTNEGYTSNKNHKNMSKLWEPVLNLFNFIGDNSGCHQIPERCFTVKGYTFPLCARCTGVFIGHFAFFTFLLLGIKVSLLISMLMLAVMFFDWFLQHIKLFVSNNPRRFVTGILGGFGYLNCAFILFKLIIFPL